jgi:hypothetical protein
MSYQRLAYDEASTTTEMASDCRAVEAALRIPAYPAPPAYADEPAPPEAPLLVSASALAVARRFTV